MKIDLSPPRLHTPDESQWRPQWRILLSLIGKDLTDLRHNSQLLVILSLPFFIFFVYLLLTRGVEAEAVLPVAIWAEEPSALVALLEAYPELQIHPVSSLAELRRLAETDNMQGVVIPAGFDAAARQGTIPPLTIYLNHRAGWRVEVERFQRLVMQEVLALSEQPLPVQLDWQDAAALTGRTPFSEQIALGNYLFIIVLSMAFYLTGTAVVSHLMAEEKEKKTVDSLLTTPAHAAAYLLGKAVIGFILSGAMFLLLTLLNGGLTGNWPLALPFMALAVLSLTGLGLLTGLLTTNTKQCNTWSSIVMLLILMPSWFGSFAELSEPWYTLFRLIPTHYLVTGLVNALEDQIIWSDVWFNLLVLLGTALGIWVAVLWLARSRPRLAANF